MNCQPHLGEHVFAASRNASKTSAWILAAPLALLLTGGCESSAQERESPTPSCPGCSVVLVSIDTLRADHLGVYGYERPTSPHLDAWAADAIVFDECLAQAPNTLLSHMSLFTGLYVSSHGVVNKNHRLPDETPTFVDVLHDNGYETAAFTGGAFVRRKFNYHTFDLFTHSDYWDLHIDERRQFGKMLKWVESRRKPFFLFWHTYKVHSPYSPLPEFDRFSDPEYDGIVDTAPVEASPHCGPEERQCNWKGKPYYDRLIERMEPADVQHIRDKYDGEILEADSMFGELLRALERAGLAQDTVIVFTSDHGETFADRAASRFIGHGVLYQEVLRVPLVLSVPGADPARIQRTVELMDLMPTVLEVTGFDPPDGLDAMSLFEPTNPADPKSAARAEFPLSGHSSVVFSDMKLIRTAECDKECLELYDLEKDPGETRNLAGTGHSMEDVLLPLLLTADDGARQTTGEDIDPELRRELESLGYL